MRTVTKSYEVYSYSELSEDAKEKAKQWYLDDDFRPNQFEETYIEDLKYLFPNSELKLEFSLSYCQGDGLNIYGKLNVMDVFNAINDKTYAGDTFKKFWDTMTEQEQKAIKAYTEVCGSCVELPSNNWHYAYCVADRTNFADDWIDELDYNNYRKIQADIIRKLESLIIDIFTSLSKTYEKNGYEYFYEVEDEEMIETCEANDWTFLEDGSYYVA